MNVTSGKREESEHLPLDLSTRRDLSPLALVSHLLARVGLSCKVFNVFALLQASMGEWTDWGIGK
jgi:hypothetical protein